MPSAALRMRYSALRSDINKDIKCEVRDGYTGVKTPDALPIACRNYRLDRHRKRERSAGYFEKKLPSVKRCERFDPVQNRAGVKTAAGADLEQKTADTRLFRSVFSGYRAADCIAQFERQTVGEKLFVKFKSGQM